jgi:hypothetical protein
MDVKTQALDRVLEALSSSLAAELDRVVQETRELLEQEFQARLRAAVRDAEEETRRQVTAELEQQFGARLEAAATRLRNEAAEERGKFEAAMNDLKNEWSVELNKVEDERERWRIFAETQRQLAEATSQSEMLSQFLDLVHPVAQGLALYVAKSDGLALWKSKGNGVFPGIISRETTDPESYFRTLSVRGRTVGAICALPPFQAGALDFLAASLERAVEVFGLKLRTLAPKPAAADSR